jgi:hydrogenase maturation protease
VTRVRILGIGSPFGADRCGWEAIDALEASGLSAHARIELQRLDRPGPSLLAALSDVEQVVLIDALRSAQAGEPVRQIAPEELASTPAAWSGHGLGVAESLELAHTLGQLPPRLDVLGIHVSDDAQADCLPEPTVGALLRAVHALLPPELVPAGA